jgi:hypothetical protein
VKKAVFVAVVGLLAVTIASFAEDKPMTYTLVVNGAV